MSDALCLVMAIPPGRRAGTSSVISVLIEVGRRGEGFHRLDGAEKAAEADFVALGILVEQRLDGQYAVGFKFRLAGLGQGQFRPDVEFELVQEGVIADWGAHLILQA